MDSDIAYAALTGPQPLLWRPHVLVISAATECGSCGSSAHAMLPSVDEVKGVVLQLIGPAVREFKEQEQQAHKDTYEAQKSEVKVEKLMVLNKPIEALAICVPFYVVASLLVRLWTLRIILRCQSRLLMHLVVSLESLTVPGTCC